MEFLTRASERIEISSVALTPMPTQIEAPDPVILAPAFVTMIYGSQPGPFDPYIIAP